MLCKRHASKRCATLTSVPVQLVSFAECHDDAHFGLMSLKTHSY